MATPQIVRPTATGSAQVSVARSDHYIGAIFVDARRLDAASVERILRAQRERELGLRFGEVGIKLGLLKQADLDFALARQFNYPYLAPGDKRVSQDVVAAFKPFSAVAEQLRLLRSQLLLRWFSGDEGHKTLAITSPGRREGRSFITANLAVVFAQLGERTLLIDADLRNPRQSSLFMLDNQSGLSNMLTGRAGRESVVRVPGLAALSVLPSGTVPPNPQELLSQSTLTKILEDFADDFDVILIDTPAAHDCGDTQTIAARAGAAIVVARTGITSMSELSQWTRHLEQSGTALVGSVLNEL